MALQGVICQKLLPRLERSGRTMACEIMFITTGIAHKIRTNRIEQIQSDIQTGQSNGSQSMASSIAKLYLAGDISESVAEVSVEPLQLDEFKTLVRKAQTAEAVKEKKPKSLPAILKKTPTSVEKKHERKQSNRRISGRNALIGGES